MLENPIWIPSRQKKSLFSTVRSENSGLSSSTDNAEDNAERVTENNGEVLSSLAEEQKDFFDYQTDEKGLIKIFPQRERTTNQ